ncbi:FBP domain-containing protein [Microbispora sp. H10830]|uniref:FBP domain-containing protein n=1 Tax=Microbispora sp. H10830 TaxID=2729109 RepID=UPI0016025A00|nr:FBP domain-containing protein [Microbispora sp. H10830]
MRPIAEREIRASFVNCTKGEAKRLAVPRDLDVRPWDDLDFLGWQDLSSPGRAYLVAEQGDRLVGVALRRATSNAGHVRRSMCSLCLTTHTGDGVSLMTARRTGGNSVGAYICTDLACSLYLRGKKDVGPGGRMPESLTLEEKISRTAVNVSDFLQKVTA